MFKSTLPHYPATFTVGEKETWDLISKDKARNQHAAPSPSTQRLYGKLHFYLPFLRLIGENIQISSVQAPEYLQFSITLYHFIPQPNSTCKVGNFSYFTEEHVSSGGLVSP